MGEALITRKGGSTFQSTERIGDIKASVRTDLGDEWALCNGAPILKSDHPELCHLLNIDTECAIDINGETGDLFDVAYNGDIYVVISKTDIYATRDITDKWEKVAALDAERLFTVACNENQWVALSYEYNSSSKIYTYYAYSTDDPYSTWNKSMVCTSATASIHCSEYTFEDNRAINSRRRLVCHDGIWAILGARGEEGRPYLLVTTDPKGLWTPKKVDAQDLKHQSVKHRLCYGNGVWAVFTASGPNYSYYNKVHVTTDPINGEWVVHEHGLGEVKDVAYYKGEWVVLTCSTTGDDKAYCFYIKYASDLFGTWHESGPYKDSLASPIVNSSCVQSFVYDDVSFGVILTEVSRGGTPYISIWQSDSPKGPFTFERSIYRMIFTRFISCGDGWIGVGSKREDNYEWTTGYMRVFTNLAESLPKITADNAYVYIKTK